MSELEDSNTEPHTTSLTELGRHVGRALKQLCNPLTIGMVTELAADSCKVVGLSSCCEINDIVRFGTDPPLLGQIIKIGQTHVTIKPLSSLQSVRIGTQVHYDGTLALNPHASWKGRVINALGEPLDSAAPLQQGADCMRFENDPPPALARDRVVQPMTTGIRVIDLFAPLCWGQRLGIFAGSGLGKSTLLRMFAAAPEFDTVVVALVGERGREVREFLEEATGQVRERTIAVVATSDESSVMRRLAPTTAVCISEYFRDQGENVLLIVDSITRFAHAARDAAMAAGEPPIARGYTPSVFADLVRLLERTGPGSANGGSITGIFSVLVDGDDHDEPVADTIRGTLDGHIVLDRSIAQQGRYPCVDPLRSLSRLAPRVWSPDQKKLVQSLRAMISRFEDGRDIRMLGGYQKGADQLMDQATELVPRLYEFLEQAEDDPPCPDAYKLLAEHLSRHVVPS